MVLGYFIFVKVKSFIEVNINRGGFKEFIIIFYFFLYVCYIL